MRLRRHYSLRFDVYDCDHHNVGRLRHNYYCRYRHHAYGHGFALGGHRHSDLLFRNYIVGYCHREFGHSNAFHFVQHRRHLCDYGNVRRIEHVCGEHIERRQCHRHRIESHVHNHDAHQLHHDARHGGQRYVDSHSGTLCGDRNSDLL
jgi:hypothetical protein